MPALRIRSASDALYPTDPEPPGVFAARTAHCCGWSSSFGASKPWHPIFGRLLDAQHTVRMNNLPGDGIDLDNPSPASDTLIQVSEVCHHIGHCGDRRASGRAALFRNPAQFISALIDPPQMSEQISSDAISQKVPAHRRDFLGREIRFQAALLSASVHICNQGTSLR